MLYEWHLNGTALLLTSAILSVFVIICIHKREKHPGECFESGT